MGDEGTAWNERILPRKITPPGDVGGVLGLVQTPTVALPPSAGYKTTAVENYLVALEL